MWLVSGTVHIATVDKALNNRRTLLQQLETKFTITNYRRLATIMIENPFSYLRFLIRSSTALAFWIAADPMSHHAKMSVQCKPNFYIEKLGFTELYSIFLLLL